MQIRTFLFYSMSILFLLTPLRKGLYFDGDFYVIELIIASLFVLAVLFMAIQKESFIPNDTIWLFALPILLAVSFFNAESPLSAINQTIRWTTYCCFFYLMYFTVSEQKYRKLLVYLIQISGLFLALFSLAAYKGVIFYQSVAVAGRLGGVLQYPNSFAALLVAMILFSLILLSQEKLNKWESLLYGLPIILYITSLLLTSSRAALLICPFAWLLGLIMLPIKQQISFFFYTICSGALAGAITVFFGESTYLVFISLGSAFIFWGIIRLFLKLAESNKIKKFPIRSWFLPIFCSAAIVICVLDLMYWKWMLPNFIQKRFLNVSLANNTFKERLIIAKDALKSSKDFLIFGKGGDGWSVLFTKYQSLPYQTRSLHNGILEWLINTGLLGLVVFLSLFGYYFYSLMKKNRKDVISVAVFVALIFIFLHSLLDFDFSYGTVWFYVLTLLAIGLPKQEKKEIAKQSKSTINKLAFGGLILFSIGVIIISYRFNISNQLFQQANSQQTIEEKLLWTDQSIQSNQYDIDKWNALGLLYSQIPGQEAKTASIARKIKQLEPNNSTADLYSIHLLEKTGNYLEADKLADSSVQIDFYNPLLRQESIQLKTTLALMNDKEKNKEKAAYYAKMGVSEYDQFVKDSIDVKHKLPNENFNSRHFQVNADTQFYGALAAYINKSFKEAEELANQSAKSKNQTISLRSLAIVNNSLEKLHKHAETNKQLVNKKEYKQFAKELENL
jgi:hypothetical protein